MSPTDAALFRGTEVLVDAVSDACGGSLDGVAGKMGVPGRVVWSCVCPSNLPIMGKPSPSASAREANEWRRS